MDEEELRENFDHFDRNRDGRLDLAEVSELMEAHGGALARLKCAQCFH